MDINDARAVLIGDIVGSRRHADRQALQRSILEALAGVNVLVDALQPLEVTIGDEFQGAYRTVQNALRASLLVRLHLMTTADVRFGIGLGVIPVFNPKRAPLEQDGPAWWCARDALQRIRKGEARSQWPRHWRTCFASEGGQSDSALNAHLLCRDELVGQMDGKDARVLLGLLRGESQRTIARDLGVSQSAVAQRQLRNGSYAISRSLDSLAGVLR